jgi:cytochrome P450 family 12
MNAATMYADNEYFPKSSEYLPERWLKNIEPSECPVGKGKAHPFKYVPFGFGPRACIGKRFAELEIETLVMRLVREFKIEWKQPDLTFDTGLVTFAVDDLKFKLTDLEN